MAYEPRAAATIQAAETSSPRESASMVQPRAPTRATAVQTATVLGSTPRRGGPAGGACTVMAAPSPELSLSSGALEM
ncbi:hypothetical protein GCM10009802_20880 [Streptomyces synnematoformans]|uniref:Uncharacterized protein n=1 Tax=Streptomyces synnematoformans TaxID=415721 RepID=A0ABN2Y1B5_9ACTN